ncbi:MAG: hypothetical protein QNJ46_28090 [Leptolyngbyaceae cyanobacterium MO_188.B28]|nr:hypothetical protein [Leptolyngbyaceae cyanobacterium MO_188.B28]
MATVLAAIATAIEESASSLTNMGMAAVGISHVNKGNLAYNLKWEKFNLKIG